MARGGSEYYNVEIEQAARFVAMRNIEGDYYEFGVYNGRSFTFAYRSLTEHRRRWAARHLERGLPVPESLNSPLRYFAFDSFAGLPPIGGGDADVRRSSFWQPGQWSTSEGAFRARLSEARIPSDRVVVVPGWFDATLTAETRQRHGMTAGCIFHVDCDLYQSTRPVLEFITPLYVDGSILIFDEWWGFRGHPGYGEQRAFREWREQHGVAASEYSRSGGQRMSFILHKS